MKIQESWDSFILGCHGDQKVWAQSATFIYAFFDNLKRLQFYQTYLTLYVDFVFPLLFSAFFQVLFSRWNTNSNCTGVII